MDTLSNITNNEFVALCADGAKKAKAVKANPFKPVLTTDKKTGAVYSSGAEYKARRLFPFATETIESTRGHFKYCQRMVKSLIQNLPRDYQKHLTNLFSKLHARDGFGKAIKRIQFITCDTVDIIKNCPFDNTKMLYCDVTRRRLALEKSVECIHKIEDFAQTAHFANIKYNALVKQSYRLIVRIVSHYKINLPYPIKNITVEQAECGLLHFFDDKFWEKQFNIIAKRTNEHLAIALGYVQKKYSPYVSRNALKEHRFSVQANQDYLNMMEVVNEETGERRELADLVKLGNADPEKRRLELMVRCRGLEELALEENHDAVFLTITAPSKYHQNSKKWNLATPRDTSDYLVHLWSLIRTKLGNENIAYSGVRVSEPHGDATPHWHMLIFVSKEKREQTIDICRDYSTREDREELEEGFAKNQSLVKRLKGIKAWKTWCEPRFTAEIIDPKKGSATGYIAKYIAKNINGANLNDEKDHDGKVNANEAAERVTAWARLWAIRQFQFFGAVSVSVYRECRRAKTPFDCEKMEGVRQAADSGNWQEFTRVMRRDKLTLVYEIDEEKNQYNEEIKRVKGVSLSGLKVLTRLISFSLQRKHCAPWSPVTNCTPQTPSKVSNVTLSTKSENKLRKLGFSASDMEKLLEGHLVYQGIQQFKIINGVLTTH